MTGLPQSPEGDEEGRDVVVDAGLATERTFLAWQRTAIGLVAAAGLATHYVGPVVGGYVPVIVGMVGVILGLTALIWMRLRYRDAHRAQTENGNLSHRGAGPLAMVSAGALLLALLVGLMPFFAGR